MKKHILIIFGPTAVGKTETAFRIADDIPAEIVNLDMGQLYTPLSIGTAKPDWKNQLVMHHMFDVIDTPRNFSVVEYRNLLLQKLDSIWKKNKLPILVGGSGFYLKSIFFPPRVDHIEDLVDQHFENTADLWQELNKIDPDRASQLNRNDIFRIRRALNIWFTTSKKPSEFSPQFNPLAPFTLFCLIRDRDDLYKRINARTRQMLNSGWIEEAEQLQGTDWELFIREKKIIGYNEIFAYLKSAKTKDDYKKMVSLIQKKTRNYAKRQNTFWRTLKRELKQVMTNKSEIVEINLTSDNLNQYIKKILNDLQKKIGVKKQ